MVILGLGSNIGDRLQHLRYALQLIKKIPHFSVEQVSPVYISDALLPDNAETSWNKPYFNLALRCYTSLTPYELLAHTKKTEEQVGRTAEKRWGPRIVDIDILAWDDLIQYDKLLHVPHEELHRRPFALWPLADVSPNWIYPLPNEFQGKTAAEIAIQWGSRFMGIAPLHCRQIAQRIDTPELVGIVNITPDSFSDGGQFLDPEQVLQQIETLVKAGANVIDIGAESTRPDATPLDSIKEWQRLEPILQRLSTAKLNWILSPKISVDTRHADVAKKAL
ncbi:MAG TPA: 2-amino-4-hydroxy-6-hydroxymethyldihydropteridine diphosphokinase, partial [Gammaproteobacteria bacterium]|nr:2-amino-4-hydroxy-6-hydroxymethyldihydropteridine diphosphokinase [Gammaproteobacteria bacterium]